MTEPHVMDSGVMIPLGGSTSAGLPYPSPQDAVCHIDQYIKDLAQAIDYRFANSAMQFLRQALATNGNGDLTFVFPKLVTVQGIVIQSNANLADGAASLWVLQPFLTGLSGNTATVHVWYVDTKTNGFDVHNFANAAAEYMVFAWGVPV